MSNSQIKNIGRLLLAALVFIIAISSGEPSQSSEPSASKTLYSVTKVVDGDTIEVEVNGEKVKVRLIGIDTPETVDPRRPVECFGKEASNKTKELLGGKMVSMESDASQDDKDRYGRWLRYVILEDGANVNKILIQTGYATEYTYEQAYKYQNEFKLAEAEARMGKLGLWADDACIHLDQYK